MKENRTCRVVGIYEAMDTVRIDYASHPEKRDALLCELRLLLVHACQDLTTDVCKIVEWYRNEASESAASQVAYASLTGSVGEQKTCRTCAWASREVASSA